MTQKRPLLCALSALGLGCGPVYADQVIFNGAKFEFQYYLNGGPFNNADSPVTFTTLGGGGTLFSLDFFHSFAIDAHYDDSVNKNVIAIGAFTTATWPSSPVSLNSAGLFIEDGWLLSIVSGVQAFTSVTLDSVLTDLSGSNFSISDVTWNSTAIAVNFANVNFSQQTQIFLDVTGTLAIPEPSTWALMLLGLAGIGFAGSRRASIFSGPKSLAIPFALTKPVVPRRAGKSQLTYEQ